jgi:endonuclease/exonuclease/phosphatase family metal-dependent hydrolase
VPVLRIASFNLENLDDRAGEQPTLAERVSIMRPQIVRLRADVLCLQEVNGQEQAGQPRALAALDALLADTDYAAFPRVSTLTQAGEVFDERNLVVLSRYPILSSRQLKHDLAPAPEYRRVTAKPPDAEAKMITWERPILHVTIDLPGPLRLELINVHLKSKNPSDVPGQRVDTYTWRSAAGWAEGYFLSSMRRVGQALEVRMVVDQLFEARADALVCVCGDFNSDAGDVPVAAIRGDVEETGNSALAGRVLVPCERTIAEPARYSLLYHGRGEMLDHVLASRELLAFYRGAEVHNELLHDESVAFAGDVMFPESDHAPVVAEFLIPG